MQNCVWKKMPKNTSGGPSGTPFWDPKRTRINFEISKIVPKTKKNEIFGPSGNEAKKRSKKNP